MPFVEIGAPTITLAIPGRPLLLKKPPFCNNSQLLMFTTGTIGTYFSMANLNAPFLKFLSFPSLEMVPSG